MPKNKYRIVSDLYNGYECQEKRWWSPFWIQMSSNGYSTNTFASIDEASDFIERGGNVHRIFEEDQ